MMRGDWCIVSNMAGIDELKIGLLWAEMAGTEWQEGNRLTVSWLIGLEFTRGEEIYCGIIPEKLMSGELVYCADVWHRFSKEQLLYYPPHPPINGDGWVYIGITLSICSSVCVSDRVHSVSPEPLNHFLYTKFGMMVYYHEAMCHAEKLVHYLQCQGHSEGSYNQNLTSFTVSSKLLVRLQPNSVW